MTVTVACVKLVVVQVETEVEVEVEVTVIGLEAFRQIVSGSAILTVVGTWMMLVLTLVSVTVRGAGSCTSAAAEIVREIVDVDSTFTIFVLVSVLVSVVVSVLVNLINFVFVTIAVEVEIPEEAFCRVAC